MVEEHPATRGIAIAAETRNTILDFLNDMLFLSVTRVSGLPGAG
ncbi:hypothetical protein GPEL0_01f3148 [Geoanaerobacter pelophilus]|uniref:Uncharacterized protein n=1 Tax=Geoanaerobacter pelophilus TaxID=60036 RepID=A0ABQ0MK41_9BACT|nr:hypothetical protein GPEL0_01f3148 [Geoanaerobacter pelophilus]